MDNVQQCASQTSYLRSRVRHVFIVEAHRVLKELGRARIRGVLEDPQVDHRLGLAPVHDLLLLNARKVALGLVVRRRSSDHGAH